jgi:hypothetical protein
VVQQVEAGVIEIHIVVADAEIRIECDADQPAVAGGLGGQVGERLRQHNAVLDDLYLPAALDDEDAAVRRDLEARGPIEAVADDQRRLEVVRRCGGARSRDQRTRGRHQECRGQRASHS